MKKIILNIVMFIVLSITIISCTSEEDINFTISEIQTSEDITIVYSSIESEIITKINSHRNAKGLSSLNLLNEVSNEAINHTNYMIEIGEISHDNFSDRQQNLANKVSATSVAENVAFGYTTAQEAVNAWLKSDYHRNNIENTTFTDFGVSTKKDKKGNNYYTQIFIKK